MNDTITVPTTAILLMRHEEISGQRLTTAGIQRARATGAWIREEGYPLDLVVSSPQWRCVETVQRVLEGGDFSLPLSRVDPRIADFALDPLVDDATRGLVAALAKELGVDKSWIFAHEAKVRSHVLRRGLEGADCLRQLVRENPGKTLLVCSHGGSRIEPMLCTLEGRDIRHPRRFYDRGSIACLRFRGEHLEEIEDLRIEHREDP